MIVQLSTSRLQIDPSTKERLKVELARISRFLPHLSEDLKLSLFMRKCHSKFHPVSKYKTHHDYLKTKLKLSNFEGWIKLILPKKVLYAQFEGLTVEEGIKVAKKNLRKEIKKYKDHHFKSQSEYPHHETIRGADG